MRGERKEEEKRKRSPRLFFSSATPYHSPKIVPYFRLSPITEEWLQV